MAEGILELGIVVLIAALLGITAKLLRQPIVVAYLVTGAIIGYFGFLNLQNHEIFQVFSDLGIMFLLFLIGLEINYTSLRLVGRASLLLGLGQIVVTTGLGYGLARLLAFPEGEAAYLALAFTFSSTIIAVKLLSEKHDLQSLYGKLSIGLLLLQDLVAMLLLVLLSGFKTEGTVSAVTLVLAGMKGVLLFLLMLYLGKKVLPLFFDRAARSPELLFLMSLAWVFLVAALVDKLGFSIAIGGFMAGLALANSSEQFQIAARIRPLRDFFILLFFVILGSSLVFSINLGGLAIPILAFSLFVIIGNPLIVLVLMGLMGYRKRTSFLTGITIAQVSEFSLILVTLGRGFGHVGDQIVSLVVAVAVITITTSAYMISHAETIFRRLKHPLSFFERKNATADEFTAPKIRKPIILVGANRTGQNIMANLAKEDVLLIDFDPEVANYLRKNNFTYIFGDITDHEVLEQIDLPKAKVVISTSPDFQDNLGLLKNLKHLHGKIKVVLRAEDEKEAKILYAHGANYVIVPHFTAGQYFGKTVAVDPEMKILESLKKRDMEMFT